PGLVPLFVGASDGQQRIVDFLSIDINKYRTAHANSVAMREKLPRHRESIDECPLNTAPIRNQSSSVFQRNDAMAPRDCRVFFQTYQVIRSSPDTEIETAEQN